MRYSKFLISCNAIPPSISKWCPSSLPTNYSCLHKHKNLLNLTDYFCNRRKSAPEIVDKAGLRRAWVAADAVVTKKGSVLGDPANVTGLFDAEGKLTVVPVRTDGRT